MLMIPLAQGTLCSFECGSVLSVRPWRLSVQHFLREHCKPIARASGPYERQDYGRMATVSTISQLKMEYLWFFRQILGKSQKSLADEVASGRSENFPNNCLGSDLFKEARALSQRAQVERVEAERVEAARAEAQRAQVERAEAAGAPEQL